MSSWRSGAAAAALCVATASAAQPATPYANVGRAATAAEVAAWDIDVRPDFKGLPKGAGTVAAGMALWEAKCASCHGVFGESNEVFTPIVGGTTKADVARGRVASLADGSFPGRTTLMKLSSVSTLWDYVYRAMPWNAPKSLTPDEVYSLVAYMLHLGDVLPADASLSDRTIAGVQRLLPNREGKTTAHALWPGARVAGRQTADVASVACMRGCAPPPTVASFIPDFARDAHGDLASQSRLVGAQRGVRTGAPATASPPVLALVRDNGCTVCHGLDNRIVGPSFQEIAARYAGQDAAAAHLAAKTRSGGSGVWGAIPMPPQAIDAASATAIGRWLSDGAKR